MPRNGTRKESWEAGHLLSRVLESVEGTMLKDAGRDFGAAPASLLAEALASLLLAQDDAGRAARCWFDVEGVRRKMADLAAQHRAHVA